MKKQDMLLLICSIFTSVGLYAEDTFSLYSTEEISNISQVNIGNKICLSGYNDADRKEYSIVQVEEDIVKSSLFHPLACQENNSMQWEVVKLPFTSFQGTEGVPYIIVNKTVLKNVSTGDYLAAREEELDSISILKALSLQDFRDQLGTPISISSFSKEPHKSNGIIEANVTLPAGGLNGTRTKTMSIGNIFMSPHNGFVHYNGPYGSNNTMKIYRVRESVCEYDGGPLYCKDK